MSVVSLERDPGSQIFPRTFIPVYDARSSGGIIPLDVQHRIRDELQQLLWLHKRDGDLDLPHKFLIARNATEPQDDDLCGIKYIYDTSGDIFAIDVPASPLHQRVAYAILG